MSIDSNNDTSYRLQQRCLKKLTGRRLPRLQSAYRPHHSTETAILKVLSDVLLAIDAGDLSALVLLDLPAAFDTVDHNILLHRLEHTFQFGGVVLEWFRSYLVGRQQHVRTSSSSSTPAAAVIMCGVPQGSVLGPILFLLYTDLLSLIESHGFNQHLFADDTLLPTICISTSVDAYVCMH